MLRKRCANRANKSGRQLEVDFQLACFQNGVPYRMKPIDILNGFSGHGSAAPDFKIWHGRDYHAFVELKCQNSSGSAENKICAVLETANNNDHPFIIVYAGRNRSFRDHCRTIRYRLLNEPKFRQRHKNVIGVWHYDDFFKEINYVYYAIDQWYIDNNKIVTTGYSLLDVK